MKELLTVLLIEDNPGDARLLQILIAEAQPYSHYDYRLIIKTDLAAGLAYLGSLHLPLLGGQSPAVSPVHLVLLDLFLPDSRGLETLRTLHRQAPDLAVVVLTGVSDEDVAIQAMQNGAQDYLNKSQLDSLLLVRSLRYALERKRSENALARQARYLQALYDTALEINAQGDLPTLLNAIVARAAKLVGAEMGGLYLLQPDGDTLKLVLGHNIPSAYLDTTLRLGQGLAGRVAVLGKPLAVSNYAAWDGQSKVYAGDYFHRVIGVPLKTGIQVTGVINVSDHEELPPFTDEEIHVVRMFADQAAIAVENARLYQEEHQRRLELSRSNNLIAALSQVAAQFETTADPVQIMTTIGSELKNLGIFIQISLASLETSEMIAQYSSAPDEASLNRLQGHGSHLAELVWPGLDWRVQRHPKFARLAYPQTGGLQPDGVPTPTKLLLSPEAAADIAVLFLPLIIKDALIGGLAVWSSTLQESDIPAVSLFANQVAVALENARLYAETQRSAIEDALTGLHNRRGFIALAEQQLKLAQRLNLNLVVLILDLDGLKQINDNLGHQAGDQALVDAAALLKSIYRNADVIARTGGDEFAVLQLQGVDMDTTQLIARLEAGLQAFNLSQQRPYQLSISAGLASRPGQEMTALDELISLADRRMYENKRSKKRSIHE
jgi:diguanylate cyclase (GGDEF)-like protein